MSEPLYLEDIFVGQRFVTGTCAMTVEAIKAYARDYDPQPFHTDEEAAKGQFLLRLGGQRLAHRRHHHAASDRQRA